MKSTKLASRYAKALFDLAKEKELIDKVNSDLKIVKEVISENHDLKAVIESPIIFADKKNNVFAEVFKGKLDEITFGFLSLLIKKKREPSLVTICNEYEHLHNDYHNIKIAYITTAQPLSEELKGKLQQILEEGWKANVQICERVDEKIIGGFIVHIDDFLFNASILAKINKLRADFSSNIYQAAF